MSERYDPSEPQGSRAGPDGDEQARRRRKALPLVFGTLIAVIALVVLFIVLVSQLGR